MASNPYAPFDHWLEIPTWTTAHPVDLRRFHRALAEALHDPAFTPEGLGEYIMGKDWGETLGFPVNKQAHCDRYVATAQHVVEHYRFNDLVFPTVLK